MTGPRTTSRTRRVVLASLGVQIAETLALVAAAAVTGSSAIVAQTCVSLADVAVQVFLVVGLYTSLREADESHPLGYGRDRYFWSLYAALAVLIGGIAVVLEETVRADLNTSHVSSFTVGYAVLVVNIVLDGAAFAVAQREARHRARAKQWSMAQYLRETSESATAAELIGNGIGVVSAVLAFLALALTQKIGNGWPDAVASGAIGFLLIAEALTLTRQNRALLTGRGISAQTLESMRAEIAAQPGVVGVPDLFAVVVGPSLFVVDGDVIFEEALHVTDVEALISRAADALRERWPEARYVYLTPVPSARPRDALNLSPSRRLTPA